MEQHEPPPRNMWGGALSSCTDTSEGTSTTSILIGWMNFHYQ